MEKVGLPSRIGSSVEVGEVAEQTSRKRNECSIRVLVNLIKHCLWKLEQSSDVMIGKLPHTLSDSFSCEQSFYVAVGNIKYRDQDLIELNELVRDVCFDGTLEVDVDVDVDKSGVLKLSSTIPESLCEGSERFHRSIKCQVRRGADFGLVMRTVENEIREITYSFSKISRRTKEKWKNDRNLKHPQGAEVFSHNVRKPTRKSTMIAPVDVLQGLLFDRTVIRSTSRPHHSPREK
ncbi:hypothetical protein Bhyg_11186 [Pseudolycoriella hygida]|uniref:Uncharacterized protein n=1 Tax=Pseudolycoriella hygida TaxID=35572 RepID=A0A9Q0MV30_9DIPT|nr:hypothetical protein Bhyg_11186 [Pseudolycoriella hygida]